MKVPSHSDSFQVLLLQLADDGRREALLGDAVDRAGTACAPFIVGDIFPDVYLEFPLIGEPFLDVTLLYDGITPGTRVESEAAAGTGAILDWFASVRAEHRDVSFGFELDTSKPELPQAAVHFQPRTHIELVNPFCVLVGEPERARLYLDLAARMPEGWPLSFFGMFRGRPDAPLRVCGYLSDGEKRACINDPSHLAAIFDAVGFSAYDDDMLAEAQAVAAAAPGSIDFQFDIYPDGRLGDTFAFDIQFEIERPEVVRASFESGPVSKVMGVLEGLGAVDARWHLAAGAAFARALPMEKDDGTVAPYSFTLIPQWMKARWRNGAIQPSKLYYLGRAGFLEESE